MQRYCTELTERLLKSLDKDYNVVDMGAVVDVITALEKTTITKEVLEVTRLGKYINELRRKTSNDALAKRAKDLVRRWRDMVLPSAHATPQPTLADTAPQALNGTKSQSPALRSLKPQSPALRALKPHSPALKNLKPHSPLMRDTTPLKQVLSPALSLNSSDHSRSPNPTPTKQQSQQTSLGPTTRTTNTTNHRLNSDVSANKLVLASTRNHSQIEAVPRTHSSNKRLRKEEQQRSTPVASPERTSPTLTSSTSVKSIRGDSNDSLASRLEPIAKRPRLNGEISNFGSLSKFSESYASNNNLVATRGLSNSSSRSLNQQVPSPRDSIDKSTAERLLSEVSTSVESWRDAADAAASTGPKKRGRKKGSKSLKNQNLPEDRVKEKLASISRNPKLKTTQELLADLQARGSSLATTTPAAGEQSLPPPPPPPPQQQQQQQRLLPARNTEPPTNQEILRNDDRSLSSRYLRSTREKSSSLRSSSNFADSVKPRTKTSSGASGGKRWQSANEKSEDGGEESQTEDTETISRNRELTVEEILAKLPPLDLDAINWSDDEEPSSENYHQLEGNAAGQQSVKEISQEDVNRLHDECIEGLNGNFQLKLKLSRDDDELKSLDRCTKDDKIDDIRTPLDAWSIAELKKKGVYRRLGPNGDDREFRGWHEMLARPSYDGQTLHILPYVIID